MNDATVTTGPPPRDRIDAAQRLDALRREVAKIVIGQDAVIEHMLIALMARGHCLLIGVPGLAKTVMARALADALDMKFARVQFTPDLMPSDVTGTNVLDEDAESGRKSFRFLPGPIFANILLADEINRTPPKTQAALLEAMQEQRVTVGGDPMPLPDPFFVIATQNPLEQEGTYPLPEAQLDRFMFAVHVGYPSHAQENRIASDTTRDERPTLERLLDAGRVRSMQQFVRSAGASPQVIRYGVALARATRPGDSTAPDLVQRYVDTGAGPRAAQFLVLAAKSRAVLDGRTEAEIEDVRAAAVAVLRHRVFMNFAALSENISSDDLVEGLLESVDSAAVDATPIAASATDEPPITPWPDALDDVAMIHEMRDVMASVRREVQRVIVGQQEVVELVLTALLAGGHCLLVGVPGLAKTMLVRTLAQVLDLAFKRIQFTPDLMPVDITGTDVMETDEATGRRSFRFMRGPIFANLLLADEINRTPPKTQAALLEAMQEQSVTAGNTTYALDPPFFVLATQNPLEQEGTYPLPEAQLDRFMFNIHLDYPSEQEEPVIIDRTTGGAGAEPRRVLDGDQIQRCQRLVRQVPISRHVLTYVTSLVRATRPQTRGAPDFVTKYVHCGAGPRASQNLVLAAKARAVMNGRLNVSIDDVRAVAVPVLRHRIFTNFSADAENVSTFDLVRRLVRIVSEPKIRQEKALEREAEQEAGAGSSKDDRLVVQCPMCRKVLKVAAEAAGQSARCTHCGKVFPVEAGS